MYDIAIVGAGVVGGMIARQLAKYQLKIVIVDRNHDVAMGATRANSAIVHAGFDAKPGSLKAKLNVRGSEMMAEIARDLGVKYENNGSLVVGFDEDDKKTVEELYQRGLENGVRDLKVLSGDEARALEPALSQTVVCALHAPTGAIVCPYELAIAAVGNAMDNGADLKLNFEVQGIEEREGHYVLSSEKEKIEAKTVINCAGVFSDEIARMVGDDSFTVIPRRGEYMLLDKECGGLVKHTVFRTPSKMGKGILVSPTVDGNLLLGPTAENIEDKQDTATTPEGIAAVIRQAGESVSGIPMNKVITSFCGLRSVGSTGDFIIRSPKANFVHCAGIESPGLSASPAIAEYVEGMLREMGISLVLKENVITKRKPAHWFRELSLEEKNRVIAKDSKYARIICRCELVSEGEILEALRTNPKPQDLDSLKRRTRSGMGRCQGGFCSPYVVELIAKECGIPYEDVTKFGGASVINVGKTKGGK